MSFCGKPACRPSIFLFDEVGGDFVGQRISFVIMCMLIGVIQTSCGISFRLEVTFRVYEKFTRKLHLGPMTFIYYSDPISELSVQSGYNLNFAYRLKNATLPP